MGYRHCQQRRIALKGFSPTKASHYLCLTELSHVALVRAEGPNAPSPGHLPGLGASALSGRVERNLRKLKTSSLFAAGFKRLEL